MKRLHFATMTFPLPERKAGDGCGYVMEAIVLLLTAVAAHFLTELHADCPTCQCAAAAEGNGTCNDSSLAPLTFKTVGSTPTTSFTQCVTLPSYNIR
eukprot:1151796-Pelagomonas_calceolata.AAC.2